MMEYDKFYTPFVVGCAFLLSVTLFIFSVLKLRSKKTTSNRIAAICSAVIPVFELVMVILLLGGILPLFNETAIGCPDEGVNMEHLLLPEEVTGCAHLANNVSAWAIVIPTLSVLQLIISTVAWTMNRLVKKSRKK